MTIFQRFAFKTDSVEVIDGVQPVPNPSNSAPSSTEKKSEKSHFVINDAPQDDDDLEMQKPVIAEVKLGEEGAQRIELMQQVWGKHGKLIIFSA